MLLDTDILVSKSRECYILKCLCLSTEADMRVNFFLFASRIDPMNNQGFLILSTFSSVANNQISQRFFACREHSSIAIPAHLKSPSSVIFSTMFIFFERVWSIIYVFVLDIDFPGWLLLIMTSVFTISLADAVREGHTVLNYSRQTLYAILVSTTI